MIYCSSLALPFLLILLWLCPGFCADGIKYGHLRFKPDFSLKEEYSDNIFLEEKDEQSEHITRVLPELTVDFAIFPQNFLSLNYKGDYRFYSEFDNFRKDHHKGGLSWNLTTPKGFKLKVGANLEDSSMQPYSEKAEAKDFVTKKIFSDIKIKPGTFNELGLRYDHTSRRFNDSIYKTDEYDKDDITFNFLYDRLASLPIVLEYTYSHQENKDIFGNSTEMNTHTGFFGIKWDPTAKLSGNLNIGYSKTYFDEADDFNGFVTKTDLTYKFSEITKFKLTLNRMLVKSTLAERETDYYYISTGGTISADYKKWDPLSISISFDYKNNEYEKYYSTKDREDNYFRIKLNTTYDIYKCLSLSLGYQYKNNDSNISTLDYKENLFIFKIRFLI